ncbi:MAG: aminotransferase class V-fold PLP-dependent enzyme [Candidatus Levybacteria bacterium]|nr:aminotransferase class V-fold PLP-dependent enzyme [Candidatus Levybacteria bacterium]
MKKVFFTVGPSQNYKSVQKHLLKAVNEDVLSISHRGDFFHQLFLENVALLKKLLNIPQDFHVFFISSGTEGMEISINNLVLENSLHLITGAFGEKFFNIAKDLGKKPVKISAEFGKGLDEDKLKEIDLSKIELLCVTQNDTSSGIVFPMDKIYDLKRKNKNLLIAVDFVSGVPFGDLEYKYLDNVFFSVQKGFGLPAGLGVLVISDKALKKSQKLLDLGKDIGSYHNLPTLYSYSLKSETPETPNVLAIFLLNGVLKDMGKYGIQRLRKETIKKADILYGFLDKSKILSPLVNEKSLRSKTTIVAKIKGNSLDLISFCRKRGIILGSGYGENKQKQVRIGNFPAHTLLQVKTLIKILSEFA